jgi:Ca2+/Na+ antiporter
MNISTYKGLLQTIQQFEADEEQFRRQRFYYCLVFFLFSLSILIGYAICKRNTDIFVSSGLVGVALTPLLTYLFQSYEKDYIDQRRAEIISEILNNFTQDNIETPKFGDGPIRFDELKEFIYGLLKSKL